MANEIGSKLKELRDKSKYSQEQVAKMIGISNKALSSYETGLRQPPCDILVSLANIYKVTTDYILGCNTENTLSFTGLDQKDIDILSNLIENIVQKNNAIKEKKKDR